MIRGTDTTGEWPMPHQSGARAIGAAVALLLTALVLAPAALAAADASPGAKAFIDGVYRAYEQTGNPPPEDGRLFAPELVRLIAKDAAVARRTGEPNLIDYRLLCGCNDDEGLRYATAVTASTARTATIRVTRSSRGRRSGRPFDLLLTQTPAGWRIADIITPIDGRRESLIAGLRQGLSGAPTPPPPPPTVAADARDEMRTAGCRAAGGPTEFTVPCDQYTAVKEVRIIKQGALMRGGVNPSFPTTLAKGGERLEATGRIHSGGVWWVGGWTPVHFVSGDAPAMMWVPLQSTTAAGQ